MINERSAEWKKLHRELKILRARKAAAGRLLPKEEERLRFLEETFGDAEGAKRQEVAEEAPAGKTRTTADGAFATEVAEDLLEKADDFKAEKAWEKDVEREPQAKVVKDSRAGKATFKQKGLSPFAVDLSADLKGLGLEEEQPEEEEQPHQVGMKRSFQVELTDETPIAGTAAPSQTPANPFAIQLDDGLASRLEKEAARATAVPDLIDRARQANVEPEPEPEVPTRADELDPELEALLQKTMTAKFAEQDSSRGGRTSFEVSGTSEATALDDELLRQAMREAEQRGQAVEVTETWQVDEQGNEITVSAEAAAEEATSAFAMPPPPPVPRAPSRPAARFSEGTTTPGADVGPAVSPSRAEPTLANVPMETQAEGSPAGLLETVADISESAQDDVPDFSDAANSGIGLLVEPEEPPPGQRKPAAEPDYDYQKAQHDDLSAVPEFEAEDLSAVSQPNAIPAAGPTASSELDSFWGLSDDSAAARATATAPTRADRPAAQSRPGAAPARGGKPAPSMPFPEEDDAPAPAARASGARPLPALNLQAVKVAAPPRARPAPPPAAEPVAAKPAAKAERPDQGADLMGSLFSEADDDPAPARGRPVAAARPAGAAVAAKPGAAKPGAGMPGAGRPGAATARPAPGARQTATKGTPLTARPAAAGAKGRPNDLRGPRKATVHFKDGASKRGTISEFDLNADWIRLDPALPGQGQAEDLNTLALKAVFLMLPPGMAYPAKEGSSVRLRMIDGRNLEGTSPDYHPQRKGFTLFPRLDQANIERVLVFNDAVKNIWLGEG